MPLVPLIRHFLYMWEEERVFLSLLFPIPTKPKNQRHQRHQSLKPAPAIAFRCAAETFSAARSGIQRHGQRHKAPPPPVIPNARTQMTDDEFSLPPPKRASHHRPAPIALPSDPRLASAAVLAFVNGDDDIDRAGAIEAMTTRAASLALADSDEALESLAEHLPVLNALFLRFSAEAIASRVPDHKTKLMKIALSSQQAYARTQALIAGLRAQREGRASVIVEAER